MNEAVPLALALARSLDADDHSVNTRQEKENSFHVYCLSLDA